MLRKKTEKKERSKHCIFSKNKFLIQNNLLILSQLMIIIIRSTHVHCTWSRSRSPFLLRFGCGPIWVQTNLKQSQAQPYDICTCVIYLTQTHLYVEHHTEKQLVPCLKSVVWLGHCWIRTLDLPNSKRTLYHWTIESITVLTINVSTEEYFV